MPNYQTSKSSIAEPLNIYYEDSTRGKLTVSGSAENAEYRVDIKKMVNQYARIYRCEIMLYPDWFAGG